MQTSLDLGKPRFYKDEYNQLMGVDEADRLKQENPDFEQFLKDMGREIVKSGLESDIGIFLVHRHFSVRAGEIMLETFSPRTKQLITRPRVANRLGDPYAAYRWCLDSASDSDHFVPLEYSNDDASIRSAKSLSTRTAFLSAFAEIVRMHRLDGLIGLTVICKRSLSPRPGEVYLEKSDLNCRSSYIGLESAKNMDSERFIETTWRFRGEIHMQCELNTWCDLQTGCASGYCYRWPDGSHEKTPHAPVPSGHIVRTGSHK